MKDESSGLARTGRHDDVTDLTALDEYLHQSFGWEVFATCLMRGLGMLARFVSMLWHPKPLFSGFAISVILADVRLLLISLIRSKRVGPFEHLRRRLTCINRAVITNDTVRRPALLRWTTQLRTGGYEEEAEPDAQRSSAAVRWFSNGESA